MYNPFVPLEPLAPASEVVMYPKPNILNPRLKDTVHIPGRGYVILRIRADNVGLWFFHCHILWHADTGMAMGFDVR